MFVYGAKEMPRTSRLERAGTEKCLKLALQNFGFKMAASLHLTAIEAIVKECVLRTGFAVRRDVYVSSKSIYRRVCLSPCFRM